MDLVNDVQTTNVTVVTRSRYVCSHSCPICRHCAPKFIKLSTHAYKRRPCSLQRRFLFDDILFNSRSSRPAQGQNCDVCGPPVNFSFRGPKFLAHIYKFGLPSTFWRRLTERPSSYRLVLRCVVLIVYTLPCVRISEEDGIPVKLLIEAPGFY